VAKQTVFAEFPILVRLCSTLALVAACGAAFAQDRPAAFFLVASPRITDPNFSETVVLILQHTPLATRGIIINRPLDVPLSRLMPDNETLEKVQRPVYFGGPVAIERLGFVFRAKQQHENAIHILDDLYLSADVSLLERVLQRKDSAREVRVYAGHAAWAPGQLEAEIERGSWFATTASPRYIFHEKPDDVWGELLKRASQRSVQAARDSPFTAAP
jgi:putative transcriptional regulator